MICDCLHTVGVLLFEILKFWPKFSKIFIFRKTFLPTSRLIVGRDAPAQGKQSGIINFSGGQSGRPDVELCLRLIRLNP